MLKKVMLFTMLFLTSFSVVKAQSNEEMDKLVTEKFPNNTYTINAISPKDYVDKYEDDKAMYESYVENQILPFSILENHFQIALKNDILDIAQDYSKANFTTIINQEAYTKELNLKWGLYNKEYDEAINNKLNNVKKMVLTDLNFIDYKIKMISDENNFSVPNLEAIKDEHITYKVGSVEGRGCDYQISEYDEITNALECNVILVYYDDVLYQVIDPLNTEKNVNDLNEFEILYIPSTTKEDKDSYLKMAQKRINEALNVNVVVEEVSANKNGEYDFDSYANSRINYGFLNNYIDKSINTFEPITAQIKIMNANKEEESINFIIAKGTTEQLNASGYAPNNDNISSSEKLICTEKDDKYYDKNGNSVSKEAYMESCGVVENPQTGSILSIFIIFLATLIIMGIYKYSKKTKLFKI